MSDLLLALHLALYINLTDKTVLLRQCFYTLVFFCLSNKDDNKTLERCLQCLTFMLFVILHIKFIYYKLILTSAFKTTELLAFSEDHIAAVRMLCPSAPSKVNTFFLWCLSVTFCMLFSDPYFSWDKYLKTLLHALLTQHTLQVVLIKSFPLLNSECLIVPIVVPFCS